GSADVAAWHAAAAGSHFAGSHWDARSRRLSVRPRDLAASRRPPVRIGEGSPLARSCALASAAALPAVVPNDAVRRASSVERGGGRKDGQSVAAERAALTAPRAVEQREAKRRAAELHAGQRCAGPAAAPLPAGAAPMLAGLRAGPVPRAAPGLDGAPERHGELR